MCESVHNKKKKGLDRDEVKVVRQREEVGLEEEQNRIKLQRKVGWHGETEERKCGVIIVTPEDGGTREDTLELRLCGCTPEQRGGIVLLGCLQEIHSGPISELAVIFFLHIWPIISGRRTLPQAVLEDRWKSVNLSLADNSLLYNMEGLKEALRCILQSKWAAQLPISQFQYFLEWPLFGIGPISSSNDIIVDYKKKTRQPKDMGIIFSN